MAFGWTIAIVRASWMRSVLLLSAIAQPMMRRLWASMTVAKYTHVFYVLRHVMSPTQTSFSAAVSHCRFAESAG